MPMNADEQNRMLTLEEQLDQANAELAQVTADVRSLADEVDEERLRMCRACREPEFAAHHSHGCALTRLMVSIRLRAALPPTEEQP